MKMEIKISEKPYEKWNNAINKVMNFLHKCVNTTNSAKYWN